MFPRKLGHPRVGGILGAVDRGRLLVAVGLPDLFDAEDGQRLAALVAEGHGPAGGQPVRELPIHVEHHRDRPQGPVAQAHPPTDALVVGAAQKSAQGGEGPVQQARGRRAAGAAAPMKAPPRPRLEAPGRGSREREG